MKKIMLLIILLVIVVSFSAYAEGFPEAYGDIYFGDSAKIVWDKILVDDTLEVLEFSWSLMENQMEKDYEKSGVAKIEGNVNIGNDSYDIGFFFFDDKLFEVLILGWDYSEDYFDTIVKVDRDSFVSFIEKSFGKADETHDIDLPDIKEGYINVSHVWQGDGRRIIGFFMYESQYCAVIQMTYSPILEEVESLN